MKGGHKIRYKRCWEGRRRHSKERGYWDDFSASDGQGILGILMGRENCINRGRQYEPTQLNLTRTEETDLWAHTLGWKYEIPSEETVWQGTRCWWSCGPGEKLGLFLSLVMSWSNSKIMEAGTLSCFPLYAKPRVESKTHFSLGSSKGNLRSRLDAGGLVAGYN